MFPEDLAFLNYIVAIALILIIGGAFGALLALADKFLKVKEDPRKNDIDALLPGVNCGACGYPGCSGLSQAMVDGTIKNAKACKVIKPDKAEALQNYIDNMNK